MQDLKRSADDIRKYGVEGAVGILQDDLPIKQMVDEISVHLQNTR